MTDQCDVENSSASIQQSIAEAMNRSEELVLLVQHPRLWELKSLIDHTCNCLQNIDRKDIHCSLTESLVLYFKIID